MSRTNAPSVPGVTTTQVFLSGQRVRPGIYRSLFSGAEIQQRGDSPLPRQSDGSRVLYVRLTRAEYRIPKAFASSEGRSNR